MFCRNCGGQIPDDAKFCPECGAGIDQTEEVVEKNISEEKTGEGIVRDTKPKKVSIKISKTFKIILLTLVICLGGFWAYRNFTDENSYEDPIESLVTGVKERDVEKIISVIPDDIIDYYSKQVGVDLKNIAGLLNNQIFRSAFEEVFSEFDGANLSYTIGDVRDCSDNEIKEIKDEIKDKIGVDLAIVEAKELDATVHVSENDETSSDTAKITVIKVGRKWFIDPISINII